MLDAVPCALQILEAVPFARGVCKVLDALISISTMDNIGIHVLVHPEFHVLLFQYQPWLIWGGIIYYRENVTICRGKELHSK